MRPKERAIGNRYGREDAIEALRCVNCPAELTKVQVSMWPNATQDEYCTSGLCRKCQAVVFGEELTACTCVDGPCCQVDVGVGIITCGTQHCPVHGVAD